MFTQTKKKVTTTNLHKEEISDYLKEEIKERDNNNGKRGDQNGLNKQFKSRTRTTKITNFFKIDFGKKDYRKIMCDKRKTHFFL